MFTIVHADSEASWRGGQRQVLELIRGLTERGHRNILACRRRGALAACARQEGIETIELRYGGEWDLATAWKLRRIVAKEHADILHAHSSHAHMLGLLAVSGLPCRFVVSRRVDFHIGNALSRQFKYGPRVDRIITVSDAIRRVLIEDGVDGDRITTVRSGFTPRQFVQTADQRDLRHELGIDRDTVVVVTVAALAPHKALHTLLKAASIVVQKYQNVKFLIAGEGKLRDAISRYIYDLQLDDFITLLGFVEDIGAVYAAGDVFALSSREEGLCSSVLDAMYFRLPVVSTNAGGIPELVQHGINGLVGPVDEYTVFADNLLAMIEDPDRRRRMGEQGRAILDQFTMERTIERTLEVYREVTGAKSDGNLHDAASSET